MAARGPSFKQGYMSDSFDNIQLYNLDCGKCDGYICQVL